MILRKYFFLFFCLIALFFTPSAVFGQWYVGKVIEDIKLNGLNNISENEVSSITSQYIGSIYSDETFWDLQGKLYALDYFEDLIPNAVPSRTDIDKEDPENNVVIEFNVTERPIISRITIIGNKSIRKNQILEVVLFKPGDMVTKTGISIDEDSIYSLYIEKGFPNITVAGVTGEPKENNEVELIFTVDEGTQTRISKVNFMGNSSASPGTLRRVIETKKQTLFSKGFFLESTIEQDKQNIINYYGEKGFIDAQVTDVLQELVEEDDGSKTKLIITFVIDEGVQYKFGGVVFSGNVIHTEEELEKLITLKVGDVLDKTKLETDFARIGDLYYNDGYIFNAISRDEAKNTEDGIISYRVRIIEQGRAHIENIIIRGNEKTKDYVIKRELPLTVGDIFSKRKIIEGISNLYNLQYFDIIEPETPQGSADGLMDLIINVEEGKTIDLQFGLTFTAAAGDFPIMAFVNVTDRNFLGRGQSASIGAEVSTDKQSLSLGFTENWLAGKRWSGGISLSVTHRTTGNALQDILDPIFPGSDLDDGEVPDPYEGYMVDPDTGEPSTDSDAITDYEYALRHGQSIPSGYLMEYESWEITLGINTGYTWHTPIGRFNTSGGYSFSRTWYDYDDEIYRPYNETVRDNLLEWQSINRLWFSFYWDTRDVVYNPSKGFFFKQGVSYVGGILPSERNYILTNTKAQFFQQLFAIPIYKEWYFKIILALNSSLSIIWNQFDGRLDITTDELLYVDGLTMARGWDRVYDGEVLWDNWVELRIPIMEKYVWMDWFYSITGIWPDKDSFTKMSLNDFYFTIGGGLRLTIPGLPIGFYFVKRYQYIDNQIQWEDGALFDKTLDFVIGFTPSFF